MEKGKVLEVKEVLINEIVNEFINHSKFNSEWLKDNFIKGILDHKFLSSKSKEGYWLWLIDGVVVGYAHLKEVEDFEALIDFRVKEDLYLTEEILKIFLEKTIMESFTTYKLQKVFYDCRDNCHSPIARTFLQSFEPHPIGWVHLNDTKFVLTKGQIDQTEEEFYMM